MSDRDTRLRALASGWDEAAAGYDAYFVPRFDPWVRAAASFVTGGALPSGTIVVPCCGTGAEIAVLQAAMPSRPIFGVDLSPGMAARARARMAAHDNVRVEVGDATDTSRWPRPAAAVLSCFGLQQMPEPDVALHTWCNAIAEKGWLSILYWPVVMESDGPFAWSLQAITKRLPMPDRTWEERLTEAAKGAGAEVVRDERLTFPMEHENAATFWDAMADSGPFRALAGGHGPDVVSALRADFLSIAREGPIHHAPTARCLVLRR